MSISTLESSTSVRMLDAMEHAEQEHAAEVGHLRSEFLLALADCQADKPALFAPRVRDWKEGGTRVQVVGEVVHGMLDYRDFDTRAMQVLLNAAAGRGTQREAQQLLEEIAAHWASLEATS